MSRTILCSLGLTTLFALTGCQSMPKNAIPPTALPLETESVEGIAPMQQFQLQGKIGIRTPTQSGSAFFNWQQEQDNFDIELSGMLGIGKTQISGRDGLVVLNSSKTGRIEAESAEELLNYATGWHAPIGYLVDWVQARPATTSAQVQKDSNHRLTQINEEGWIVELSYNQQATQPNRLILKQTLENGTENRITMVIQNR